MEDKILKQKKSRINNSRSKFQRINDIELSIINLSLVELKLKKISFWHRASAWTCSGTEWRSTMQSTHFSSKTSCSVGPVPYSGGSSTGGGGRGTTSCGHRDQLYNKTFFLITDGALLG